MLVFGLLDSPSFDDFPGPSLWLPAFFIAGTSLDVLPHTTLQLRALNGGHGCRIFCFCVGLDACKSPEGRVNMYVIHTYIHT